MERGWIKLHRALLKNALWKDCNANQKTIMITLLLMAAFDDNSWIYKGEKFETKPGQFITSLKSIAEASGCSESTIRRSLVKFQTFGFCTSKATNKNRLITIVNWGKYQEEFDEPTSKPTSNRQATDKQPTTNKNVRNKECNKYINNILRTTSGGGGGTLREKVISSWNSLGENIPKIQAMNDGTKRYKSLKARIAEVGIEKVLEAIERVRNSKFLNGHNQKGWTIDFDWFIKPNNFIKVLEGNYEDRKVLQEPRYKKTAQSYVEPMDIPSSEIAKRKIEKLRNGEISFKPREE